MAKTVVHTLRIFICAVLMAQLMGCGTILYPEREGQKSGQIDAGVAILDGMGVLFFIVPGVIAFAVDFYNGTIYLPGTSEGRSTEQNIQETAQNAGQALKSAGRHLADSIRHVFQ
jgi:hypothetical protein